MRMFHFFKKKAHILIFTPRNQQFAP